MTERRGQEENGEKENERDQSGGEGNQQEEKDAQPESVENEEETGGALGN